MESVSQPWPGLAMELTSVSWLKDVQHLQETSTVASACAHRLVDSVGLRWFLVTVAVRLLFGRFSSLLCERLLFGFRLHETLCVFFGEAMGSPQPFPHGTKSATPLQFGACC